MEPFIQIMIADADLRLLPVKAIARWPPGIRSTFAPWIIHLSSVGAGLAFQVDPSAATLILRAREDTRSYTNT